MRRLSTFLGMTDMTVVRTITRLIHECKERDLRSVVGMYSCCFRSRYTANYNNVVIQKRKKEKS